MPDNFGLIHIYCGNGKGKTSSGIGQIIRALGYGHTVLAVRFLKTEGWPSGEVTALRHFDSCRIISAELSSPFFYDKSKNITKEKVAEAQKKLLNQVFSEMGKKYDIILLDEILNTLPDGYLSEEDVFHIIEKKPKTAELILTGRPCPENIVKKADLVTEMMEMKHPFQNNVPARKGIDF